MNTLLTATHLLQWAETRASQGKLPALVRRLILASVDRQAIQRIDFPAEDSVYRPGVDGILQVVYGNAYVPAGQSVWEMGAGEDPEVKANGDYTKRASNPGQLVPSQNAFMFVTPRRWLRKNDWIATKTKENIWAGVRAYDADDLEQWLETCPAVAAWACRLIRTLPEGLCDIREMWEQWQSRTNPELSPQLLLAGRAAAVDRVRLWLANAPSCLRVRADSTDEVLGFLAAVIENENELERTRLRLLEQLLFQPLTCGEPSLVSRPLLYWWPTHLRSDQTHRPFFGGITSCSLTAMSRQVFRSISFYRILDETRLRLPCVQWGFPRSDCVFWYQRPVAESLR